MSRDARHTRTLRSCAWLLLMGVALVCGGCSRQATPERSAGMASPAGDPGPLSTGAWTPAPLADTPTATPTPGAPASPTHPATATPPPTPPPPATPTLTFPPTPTPTSTPTPTLTFTPTATPTLTFTP
ncbi:MAG: hypothetical protein ACUVS5_14805, partial [Anaerolineae bacterium]